MPDVIHADPDKYHIGVLGKDVIVHTQVKVIHLIASDACTDEIVIGISFLRQGVLHFNNITAGFGASLGNGVAEEDHFLSFNTHGGQKDHNRE